MDVADWFAVEFDDARVKMRAAPPGRDAWEQEFLWADVIRVCYKAEDFLVSDGIYVFTKTRPESYVIPTEATGGAEVWNEIIRRGLFDAALAIEAVTSGEGLFCWPPVDDATGSGGARQLDA